MLSLSKCKKIALLASFFIIALGSLSRSIQCLNPPIISYGGTYSVLTLAIMGLMLSIYRRKDMVPHGGQVRE